MKRVAERNSAEEAGLERLAKTPRTARKTRPGENDDEDDESMRYPLRSRTPISGMKRLGLYVPPQARVEALKRASMSTELPAPRHFTGLENETPARVVAFTLPAPKSFGGFSVKRKSLTPMKPITSVLKKPEPLAVLCRDAARNSGIVTRMEAAAADTERMPPPATRVSATRRGSRSRGGRGRGGVKVVIVPPRQ